MNNKIFTLSIESAVAGGSVSLLEKDREIDYWIGSRDVSQAEILLEAISEILGKNRINKTRIKNIINSEGAGSITGAKIGLAITKGLNRALKCECKSIEILRAMLVKKDTCDGRVITAIPVGNNQICWQSFEIENNIVADAGVSHLSLDSAFLSTLEQPRLSGAKYILHEKIYNKFSDTIKKSGIDKNKLLNAGKNLAYFMGLSDI